MNITPLQNNTHSTETALLDEKSYRAQIESLFEKTPLSSLEEASAKAKSLLFREGIDKESLRALLEKSRRGVNFGEIYLESTAGLSLSLSSGIVRSHSYHSDNGIGARLIVGEQTGFAYTDTLSLRALEHSLLRAGAIRHFASSSVTFPQVLRAGTAPLYGAFNPIHESRLKDFVALLEYIDRECRKDPLVHNVQARISLSHKALICFATDGTEAYDHSPMVSLRIMLQGKQNERRENAFSALGGRLHPNIYQAPLLQGTIAALRDKLHNALQSESAPAGEMPVVLGAGFSGILFHEAVGHSLEGDGVRKKSSKFADKKGKMVASPLCTLMDSGLFRGRRGSTHVDDEGTPTQNTHLIESGKLVGFLWDKHNAVLEGVRSTGSGRRESYRHPPLPRMRNTHLAPGTTKKEDIIASLSKGIYMSDFGGGEVDTTSGQFVFSAEGAFLIENGKLTQPLKGASLIGDGLSVLQKISAVGDDWALDDGAGDCGKDGQWVPVGVGQPTLKIDKMTVGGAEHTA